MSYHHHRQARPAVQIQQEVEHLAANRHVERRDRFIEDQELRVAGNCPRNRDTLALTPGQLARRTPEKILVRGQPHTGQELEAALSASAPRHEVVDCERLREDAPID
jgi:hypothetical protein